MSGSGKFPRPPGLSSEENKVLNDFGGWNNFTESYGLKAYDDNDVQEAKEIVREFAKLDQASGSSNNGHGNSGQGNTGKDSSDSNKGKK